MGSTIRHGRVGGHRSSLIFELYQPAASITQACDLAVLHLNAALEERNSLAQGGSPGYADPRTMSAVGAAQDFLFALRCVVFQQAKNGLLGAAARRSPPRHAKTARVGDPGPAAQGSKSSFPYPALAPSARLGALKGRAGLTSGRA